MGWGNDGASTALSGNKRRGEGMTLQEWLEQEERSWFNAGKPDGWCSGWSKERVRLGLSEYSIRVSFRSSGNKLIELDNQEVGK